MDAGKNIRLEKQLAEDLQFQVLLKISLFTGDANVL